MNRTLQTSIVLEPATRPYVVGETLVHSADDGWTRRHVEVINTEVKSFAPHYRPTVQVVPWGLRRRAQHAPTAELYREVHP